MLPHEFKGLLNSLGFVAEETRCLDETEVIFGLEVRYRLNLLLDTT